MNKYITVLICKGLLSHQTLIENNLLMKRENRSVRPCTTTQMVIFSFGKCFDETMMRMYNAAIQQFGMHIHQFIGFSIIIKP